MTDLQPIRHAIGEALRRMGLGDPAVLADLVERWEEVAGEPWASLARPVVIRDGELIVEASDGGAVGMLRYGTTQFLQKLEAQYGAGVVRSIIVRQTGRRGRE